MNPRRMLGLFAHPDDEVFCAGGSFARYVDQGFEAMVVSATRGEAGCIRDANSATRKTLGSIREKELEECCQVLGIQSVRCLGYQDGTLAELDPDVLAGDFAGIISGFQPDVVITFGDDGAYGHPDHVAVSRATTAAFERVLGTRGPARLYHSHFPRSRMLMLDRLSQWLMDLGARFRGQLDFVKALSIFAEETTTMRYSGDHVDTVWAPPGTYMVEQGEPATSLYLILSGRAEVFEENSHGSVARLRELGPGEFFGELGVATGTTRSASVVAMEPTTCLVLSPSAPTDYRGRGEDAQLFNAAPADADDQATLVAATTVVDVSEWVGRKIAGIAAHRTQYPIDTSMFPESMLLEMFGHEYFVRVFPPIEPEAGFFSEGS